MLSREGGQNQGAGETPCFNRLLETGGFTFSDERNNRNHIRLGYSVIRQSLIPEGIGKIARALPRADCA